MRCLIEIAMDNAAFDGRPMYELARILRGAADRLDQLGYDGDAITLRDMNGNKVGELVIDSPHVEA